MFYSYSSFKTIQTDKFSARELQAVFDKGSNLLHIKALKEMIRKDFRNHIKFFTQKMVVIARVADRLFSYGSPA